MKKFVSLLVIVLILSSNVMAENGKDTNRYNVLNEADFTIIMYGLKNSMVSKFGQGDEVEGKLRTAFVLGNLELLQFKKSVIENMKKENFEIMKNNFDIQKIDQIQEPVMQAVNNYIPTVKSLSLEDAFISMYMQIPEFYGQQQAKDYPDTLLYNAKSIAISRFDNRYWFNKIKNCYNDDKSDNDMVNKIRKCAKEYEQLVSDETNIVLKQLEPYKNLYEELR